MGTQALALTQAALAAPSDLKGVFEIEAFKNNCVANYEKTTGQKNGELVFERERMLFMKAISDNKKLEGCTRLSIYTAFVELAVSGLTLNDGITYIIPYKETAQFQIGWKGRLEQMSQMPEVNFVPEPQVVLTNELPDFDYELGETPRIIKHKPAKDRTISPTNKIEFVYLILDTKFGKRTFMMTRQEVLTIRDTYSVSFKQYLAEVTAQGKKIGDTVVKKMRGYQGRPDWDLTLEPPFWITNEAEAFKKTLVKRAYKYLPKTPRMKAIDEKIKQYIDHEDGTAETTQDIDYGLADNQPGTIGDNKQIAQTATPEQKGDGSPQGNNSASTSGQQSKAEKEKTTRTRRTKEQIAKDEADKKAAEKKAAGEPEVITTAAGNKVDTSTGEQMPDGPSDDANPVDELPDLSGLKF